MLRLALLALVLGPQQALTPFAKIQPAAIGETSGIVRSTRYPGVYWVHNDSGDSARIFAIDLKGKAVAQVTQKDPPQYAGIAIEGAKNVDWEDIASDGIRLYLGDVGNNGNARRDLAVYVVDEPNPYDATKATIVARYPVAYPDQTTFPPKDVKPFDCEAIFCLRGRLYFITKVRDPLGLPMGSASLYRLDTRYTDRTNVLTKLDTRIDLGGWVTAADVSPDGKRLAVLTHFPVSSVWLFDTNAPGDRFLTKGKGRQVAFTGAQQCEAVCWESKDALVIANEQRGLYRLRLKP